MNRAVFHASEHGDLDAVKNMHPRDLRRVTFEGDTALHIAAREGHLSIVEWILDNEHLSERIRDFGHVSIVEWIRGMSGKCNDDGNTPLHEAAKGGNPQVVSMITSKRPRFLSSASEENKFGETPLLIACEYGHVEAAKVLVEATPMSLIFSRSNNGPTCLDVAAYGGHLDIVKLLFDERKHMPERIIEKVSSRFANDIPLHRAVHGGHVDIVREILRSSEWKYFMTKKDEFGRCAVHVAVVLGRLSIIDEFVSSFPSCDKIRSQDFKPALHFAVEYNRIEVVQTLLFHKDSVKVAMLVSCDCDISGNTALHLGAIYGVDSQLMEYLLSFPGVKINAVNNEGLTALDIATIGKQPAHATIKYILEAHGATKNVIPHSIKYILEAHGATKNIIPHSNSISQESEDRGEENDDNKKMDLDIVVASLIATVTFAAIFQIPGGIENDQRHVQNVAAKFALDKVFKLFLIF